MAFQRCCILAVLLLSLLAVELVAAAGPGDIVVFWGRNKDEGSLREACDVKAGDTSNPFYTTVIISFLTGFGGHGRYPLLDLSGHPLAGVGDDIKHCQAQGILVLLSIGGPGGGGYSLPTSASAADLAVHLWNAYLDGHRAGVRRPFGDAVVDGVDFFIDGASNSTAAKAGEHYDELARRLHGYDSKVMLTATVRCAYPDPRQSAALATGLFGRVHVRLYGDLKCTWGDREAWEAWAAAYPGSKVFVGVVASEEADPGAFMSEKDLYYNVLQFAQTHPNYGGIMVWNRCYNKKSGYLGAS